MKAMKLASIITGTILLLYAVFLLVWLWSDSISWAMLIKVSLTAAVVVVAVFGLAVLYQEYIEEKNMKEEKYLD